MRKINLLALRKLHGKLHDRKLAFKQWKEEYDYIESAIERSLSADENTHEIEPDYPVDIVVTWVNGSDPEWLSEKANYSENQTDNVNEDASRFRDWDTFRYWFRAVEHYAPWVNRVYLATWGHVPAWLNLECPKLKVVRHDEFIPKEYLPTFSSHTIEWNLWRIPGLSEHFIYFNDDMFITKPVKKADFFSGELPKYCAVAYPLRAFEHMNAHRHARLNSYGLFNSNYSITQCMVEHPDKWFNYQYADYIPYNVRAYNDDFISGMFFSHLGVPFRKKAFQEFYERFHDHVDRTCRQRFRTPDDIMHQAVQLWEMYRGSFGPVGRWHYGVPYFQVENYTDKEVDAIKHQKYRMICINDHEGLSADELNSVEACIVAAFDEVLPQKSCFEK